MAKKNYDLLFKLLLIGDSGVGKVSRQDRRKSKNNIHILHLDMYSISFLR